MSLTDPAPDGPLALYLAAEIDEARARALGRSAHPDAIEAQTVVRPPRRALPSGQEPTDG